MEQQAQAHKYPPWLQQTISVILGAAVLYLTGAYVNNLITDARRDERIKQLELSLAEFRKPGARYSANDGKRDRDAAVADSKRNWTEIDKLKHEFRVFSTGGSRFLPLGLQIQAQINECKTEMVERRNNWIQCIRFHENVMPRLDFLEQQNDRG